jgi:NTE family protein
MSAEVTSSEPRADLVLEGGGVLGIAHVGAVSVLEAHGYRFPRLAGTSAGAIVATLLAAGMSGEDIRRLLEDVRLPGFLDRGLAGRVPLIGPALELALDDGVYEGDVVRKWLGDRLAERGVETFADLRIDDPQVEPGRRYRLVVVVADVSAGELIRLPWDYADRYGLDPDTQLVADAVRASISIPFFFEPARLRHADGATSVLVDGGVLSNFPIGTFDRTDALPPRWPTFGVKLIPHLPADATKLLPFTGLIRHGPLRLLEQVIATTTVGHDQTELAKPCVAARTMQVDTDSIDPLDFDISTADRRLLVENGRAAAEGFVSTWSWEDYLARCRP